VRTTNPCLGALSKSTFLVGLLAGSMPALTDAADPSDPGVSVPSTTYKSALPASAQNNLEQLNVEQLPWRKLFEADGSFAPDPGTQRSAVKHLMKPQGHMSMQKVAPNSTANVGSDARGLVKFVDERQGKVKLKHGPIRRLDMPGMTMVFRVKDAALLNNIKPGDEVGFTVEVDGSKFYVTGFQK
jgi:Cu(I)/Ag(I) efflux system protein CusF